MSSENCGLQISWKEVPRSKLVGIRSLGAWPRRTIVKKSNLLRHHLYWGLARGAAVVMTIQVLTWLGLGLSNLGYRLFDHAP